MFGMDTQKPPYAILFPVLISIQVSYITVHKANGAPFAICAYKVV